MIPMSITEKLKTLFGIISSSTFFLIALIISVILLITIIISLKKFKKIGKKLFIISWIVVVIVLLVRYYEYIFQLADSFIENIFMAIYFPNLAVFTMALIINNAMLYTSILKRSLDMIYRIIWITSAILTNFLFVLILDIVVSSKIDIYTASSVYSNKNLFVLLEINMAIFTVSIILTIICFVIKKITRDKKSNITNINEYSNPVVTPVQTPLVENKVSPVINQQANIPVRQNSIQSSPVINNQNVNTTVTPTAIPVTTQPILAPISNSNKQNFPQPTINNQNNNVNNTNFRMTNNINANVNNNNNINQASILDEFNFTDQNK